MSRTNNEVVVDSHANVTASIQRDSPRGIRGVLTPANPRDQAQLVANLHAESATDIAAAAATFGHAPDEIQSRVATRLQKRM